MSQVQARLGRERCERLSKELATLVERYQRPAVRSMATVEVATMALLVGLLFVGYVRSGCALVANMCR